MSTFVLLTYYCGFILAASLVGGLLPMWLQLTHRRMQFAVSFVAGVMLGVGVLHMLPHAIAEYAAATVANGSNGSAALTNIEAVSRPMGALLAGMLVMFFIERFFAFHHHDVGQPDALDHSHSASCDEQHHHHHHDAGKHDLSWGGAALGLALHSVLNGVALAAAVEHGSADQSFPGLGTFLVIFLHKPFDAMTIGMLMARGRSSLLWRQAVNGLFSLAIPLGAAVFYYGFLPAGGGSVGVAYALAFSAGTFLCISLSDLLPELQFHQHDRVKLSLALLAGLGVAYAAGKLEAAAHGSHSHPASNAASAADSGTK
jgi:zinc and cadmium transporter